MTRALGAGVVAAALGCGGGAADDPGSFVIDVAPIALGPGEETDRLCYSVTLDNDASVYVSRVEMAAGVGVHHSNWLFVPDDIYPGPDGLWPCADRGFDAAVSAALGGVLFGQSTQATSEVQEFEPGAVIAIPPRSRVVGNLHLLNATDRQLDVATTVDVRAIPASDVRIRLAPIYLQYLPLDIPPMQRAEFTTDCDLGGAHEQQLDRPLDLALHYVLPHYHALGVGLSLELIGGGRDGEVAFATDAAIGEPWGRRLDPPLDLTGATGLRLSCAFDNPTARTVGWGIGDDEMCIAVGFVDSELIWGGGVFDDEDSRVVSDDGAVRRVEGDCSVFTTPLRG